ncbi:MAG TPA: hypothetical protein PLH19_10855 [Anaerolineae bacterium]|nr:hypothetical protein [Anaerolineae bacterium]HQH39017.1 hypothetical protein [Anaerolineae bacterium]
MPPLTTHLVVAERVFPHLEPFGAAEYGAFLTGNLVVDVNGFTSVSRRTTHFVGRFDEDGEAAFTASCANFLKQRGRLLSRPWVELTPEERAFVAGYLCHLAADELWKAMSARLQQAWGLNSPEDMPVPPAVVLTAFSVASHALFVDFAAVAAALDTAPLPDVFTHVAHADFLRMWDIVHQPLLQGNSPESFFEMLARSGQDAAELQKVREQHACHWDAAMALVEQVGGVEAFVTEAAERALEILPDLWRKSITS